MSCRFIDCRVGILIALSLQACAHRDKVAGGDDSGEKRQRSLEERILAPDRSKRSSLESKVFRSSRFTTKGFKTKKAHAAKPFHGSGKAFNVAAHQGQEFSGKRSRYQEQVSPLSKKTARTFASRFEDKEARTKTFSEAGKAAPKKTAYHDGKVFKTREYPVTERATENAIRGSDLSIGQVTGAPPGGVSEDGRLLSRPADLRPDYLSPIGSAAGKTRSIEEIRQLLNKGSR